MKRAFHILRPWIFPLLTLLALPASCAGGRSRTVTAEELPPARPDTLSIYVVGDIMCHGLQLKSAHALWCEKADTTASVDDPYAYDWSTEFAPLQDRIEGADLAVGNVEFPFAGAPFTGFPDFSAPESYLDYLTDVAGFDVLLAANNHILDKGRRGLERTLEVYRAMEAAGKAQFAGISGDPEEDAAHYPLPVEVGGVRLGIINFTYGTNYDIPEAWPKVNRETEREEILAAIQTARERDSVDLVLVFPHWGEEYDLHHNAAQEALADEMIAAGADAIVGHHPHRIQDMELRSVPVDDPADSSATRLVPLFYSVGNAVSNQNDPEGRIELAVTLRIERSPEGEVRMLEPLWEYIWCTKAGMILPGGYAVIPVREYLGRPEAWLDRPEDYEKMVATYRYAKQYTAIPDEEDDLPRCD